MNTQNASISDGAKLDFLPLQILNEELKQSDESDKSDKLDEPINFDLDHGNVQLSEDLMKTLNEPVETAIIKEVRKPSEFLLVHGETKHILYLGENTIGRLPSNDLAISNQQVSRKHATLTVSDSDNVEVKDHSLNGTGIKLNNLGLEFSKLNKQSALLEVGDEIAIYGFLFKLERKPKENGLLIAEIGTETALVQKASRHKENKLSRPNNSSNGSSNNSSSSHSNKGFSLIELLIVIIVIGIIAVISVGNLISSRRAANGASAIQTIRVITSSQVSYQVGVGNGEYALPASLLNEGYIDQSVASACLPTPTTNQTPKSGYIFVFNTTQANPSSNTLAGFSVSGRPLLSNGFARSGDKSFFVDQTGVLRFSSDPSMLADSNSQPLQ
ncbi:MAG: FHA domain-containing protein [Blastocatellia bacterium]